MRVNNLSKVALDSAAAGIEPAIDLQSQVQRPNHYATEPHKQSKSQKHQLWSPSSHRHKSTYQFHSYAARSFVLIFNILPENYLHKTRMIPRWNQLHEWSHRTLSKWGVDERHAGKRSSRTLVPIVRENVFFVFLKIQKNVTFYVFLTTCQKNEKSTFTWICRIFHVRYTDDVQSHCMYV